MRQLLAAVVLAALPIIVGVPASAAPATHDVFVEEYEAYEPFAVGDGQPCVPWAGTFHEMRSGEVKLVTVNSARGRARSMSTV